jgi:hypothetical protein
MRHVPAILPRVRWRGISFRNNDPKMLHDDYKSHHIWKVRQFSVDLFNMGLVVVEPPLVKLSTRPRETLATRRMREETFRLEQRISTTRGKGRTRGGGTKVKTSLDNFAGSGRHRGSRMLVSPFAEKGSRCGFCHKTCGICIVVSIYLHK